jgi:hypothetical protein
MDLDVDAAKVLYVLGVLFGIAALLYFARDIVFELSITVRALLLFLAFAALLVGALVARGTPSTLVSSVLSAAAYVAFLGYTLSRFAVGADGNFFALLLSAGLFLALGYLVREREMRPSRRTARYALVGIALLAVIVVGADVLASDVTYEVTIDESATVDENGRAVVGTTTVTNRFVFREPIDVPRRTACLSLPDVPEYDGRPLPLQYRVDGERVPSTIPGRATYEARMTVRLHGDALDAVDGPLPISEAADCPADRDERGIVVVGEGGSPRPPPA